MSSPFFVLLLATALTSTVTTEQAELVEELKLEQGTASQGIVATEKYFFTSNATSICQYNRQWKFIKEKTIKIKGVNHVGAIDSHGGFIWAGLLHGPEGGKHNPKLNKAIIAKIRQSDLEVTQTWDLTAEMNWIDPVCFDGNTLWVGDLSDMGLHRYKLIDGKFVRQGILRYPNEMHFSQGIRVVGNKLYSIHTFGKMDGLFEFELPAKLSDSQISPLRVWPIQDKHTHLEGFTFSPEKPTELWHAQGKYVHRYQLGGLQAN